MEHGSYQAEPRTGSSLSILPISAEGAKKIRQLALTDFYWLNSKGNGRF